jgi:hypothetical protein
VSCVRKTADQLNQLKRIARTRQAVRPTTADRIVAIALACSRNCRVLLNRWPLRRLRRYLQRRKLIGELSVEGLRQVLRRAGASWQRIRTWKIRLGRPAPVAAPRRHGRPRRPRRW